MVSGRLELAFARQTLTLDRIGKLYDNADQGFPQLQNLLDKAKQRGLDVSQIESALDTLKTALTNARPAYDQAKSLHDAHNGFDANGKVTDPSAARDTIKGVHDALSQFRTDMDGAGKALREAIKAFRQANPRPTPAPTSTGNS